MRQLGEEEINSARTDSQSDSPRQVLVGTYIIPGTEFYAVTSYRNRDVVETKIRQNKSSRDDSKEGETPSTPRDTVADEPTTSAAVTANVQQPTTASPMLGRSLFPLTETSPSGGTQRIQCIPQEAHAQFDHQLHQSGQNPPAGQISNQIHLLLHENFLNPHSQAFFNSMNSNNPSQLAHTTLHTQSDLIKDYFSSINLSYVKAKGHALVSAVSAAVIRRYSLLRDYLAWDPPNSHPLTVFALPLYSRAVLSRLISDPFTGRLKVNKQVGVFHRRGIV
ncbi:unnamed protein product [Mesocestoides corti]|uniref:T-box domain-containing protein n=1 Tax=Mesocestoides corti TaxID=53468 RepID=A0A3P6GH52_MESCO|nr:unnamed protein product [Mesocestoides corti]